MKDNQNTTNQSESNNTNTSQDTISQDIFVMPRMSSETRGENYGNSHTTSVPRGIEMKKSTFTKETDD